VRRHRVGLALVGTVFALLAAATLMSLQQARKARLEAERAEAAKQFLASLFQQARPGSGSDPLSAQQLLDEGRVRLEREMRDQPRLSGELLNTIGNAYAHLGDYTHAATQLERALQQLPPQGDTLRPRLDALVDLVDLFSHQGKREEGERYADEALALLQRLRAAEAAPWGWLDAPRARNYFGDAAQTLESRAEDLALARARLLDLRGERDAAIALRQEVADARDAREGEHPTRVRTAQNDLALALSEAGRNAEAVLRFERLLRDNEREHGPGHASGVTVRHNLALALRRLDRLAEAERIERENAAVAARALPPNHPMQSYIANVLAGILRGQGRHREAAQWYGKARAVFDGQPDADRDMLATVHFNDALNRLALYDSGGALAALEAADGIWQAAFGPAYPRRIALAQQRVAVALQVRDGAAADAALAVLDAAMANSSDPAQRARRAQLAAQRHRLANDPAAAAAALAAQQADADAAWPANHPERIGWLLALAENALDRQRRDEADAWLTQAMTLQSTRGLPPPDELLWLQARAACSRGAADCAVRLDAAAAAWARELEPAAWPRRLTAAWQARAAACAAPSPATRRALEEAIAGIAADAPEVELEHLRRDCATAR
jgi:eukaryotic-like serine/threonine-protein kinase